MFLGPRSRHILTRVRRRVDGVLIINEREPFRFRLDRRNRAHRVKAGDTLWTLAERYYSTMRDASDLWWIIADFQDPPILDPTVRLEPNSIVIIPPEAILLDIFSEDRRDADTLV